jgi:hypothetical protein
MVELPPQSRISLRMDREGMTITIPKSSGKPRGSWGLVAIAAFLAVAFIAQGVLSGNHGWTGAGLLCFIVAAWQFMLLRGMPGNDGQTKLQITGEWLARIVGTDDAPQRLDWQRSSVSEVRVETDTESNRAGVCARFNNKQPPVWLVFDGDLQELEWIAEQIRIKWAMGQQRSPAVAAKQISKP